MSVKLHIEGYILTLTGHCNRGLFAANEQLQFRSQKAETESATARFRNPGAQKLQENNYLFPLFPCTVIKKQWPIWFILTFRTTGKRIYI